MQNCVRGEISASFACGQLYLAVVVRSCENRFSFSFGRKRSEETGLWAGMVCGIRSDKRVPEMGKRNRNVSLVDKA